MSPTLRLLAVLSLIVSSSGCATNLLIDGLTYERRVVEVARDDGLLHLRVSTQHSGSDARWSTPEDDGFGELLDAGDALLREVALEPEDTVLWALELRPTVGAAPASGDVVPVGSAVVLIETPAGEHVLVDTRAPRVRVPAEVVVEQGPGPVGTLLRVLALPFAITWDAATLPLQTALWFVVRAKFIR